MTASGEALPTFSVVVPTYRRPRELRACVAALAALDYPAERYEIVVVDDGSEPPIERIGDLGRPGLQATWLWQPNAGPASARNAGARAAAGEYLAFTDDDCAPRPGWLRGLAAAFARHPEGLCGGATENGLEDNGCAIASQIIVEAAVARLHAERSDQRFFASNNLALPAAGFRAIGGFDPSFRTAEDRELCDRWLRSGRPLVLAPAAEVVHRHDLTLAAFWRQHFGYGRGAFRYHCARMRRSARPSLLDAGVCRTAFRRAAALPSRRMAAVAALLCVWQAANVAGFVWQGVASLRRNGVRTP